MPDDDFDERSFFQRHRGLLIFGVLVLVGGVGFAISKLSGSTSSPRKAPEMTMVSIKLPPPPPTPPPLPPPPPPPPMEQPKMMEQAPVDDQEEKPDDKPPEEPPSLTTNNVGSGPGDGFGLGRGTGRGGIGGSGRSKSGSRFGWYAGQVQTRIADAMRSNRKTRKASINGIQVRVWPDTTGRITRAQIAGSTGDVSVDAAIQNEVLSGLQLSEPPPKGMPTPIVLRLTARRPN
jgi:outer membrane biosynthesis protein TonB